MLFACSGITLPHGPEEHITRFVTSTILVTKFNAKRNRDDKLRVSASCYSPCFNLILCFLLKLFVVILC